MENSKDNYKKIKYLFIAIAFCLVISFILNIILLCNKNMSIKEVDENIVFFGDSITSHYDVVNFFPRNNVVNKGIDGDKSEDLISRLKKDIYDSNPSKVLILVGINDIANDVDSDDITLNIQTIIHSIKINRGNAKIYIESVYPVNEKILNDENRGKLKNVDNEQVIELNKKLKSLCSSEDVVYIDIYDDLLNKDKVLKEVYTYDGAHLTNLGYLKVTSLLKKYIQE